MAASTKSARERTARPRRSNVDVPRIRRATIDGVPVFWTDAPPPLRVVMRFRVGRADESLATGGITHLVEHLALSTLGQPPYQLNGWVGPTTTTFAAAGEREDVNGFIDRTCASLQSLPLDRLAGELRILNTEAAQRRADAVSTLLAARYGAQSYGLSAYEEFGFRTVSAEEVEAHAREWFTCENAVVWLSGPPDGLSFDLPSGTAHGLPMANAVLTTPAWQPHSRSLVAASYLGARTPATTTFLRILERRLWQRLRHEDAVAYSVFSNYERVGRHAHLCLWTDPLDEQSASAASAFAAVLLASAQRDVTKQELIDDRKLMRQSLNEPASALGWVDLAANEYLLDGNSTEPAERMAQYEALTSDDLAVAASAAAESLLLLVPGGAELTDIPRARSDVEPALPGRGYKPMMRPGQTRDRAAHRLVVGAQGVSVVKPKDREVVSVAWDECAGVGKWTNGRRTLWGRDGSWVRVEPSSWVRGKKAVREIDSHVPPGCVIPMGDVAAPPRRKSARTSVSHLSTPVVALAFALLAFWAVVWGAIIVTSPGASDPVEFIFCAGAGFLASRCARELLSRVRGKR